MIHSSTVGPVLLAGDQRNFMRPAAQPHALHPPFAVAVSPARLFALRQRTFTYI
jgi:hypothetical protein